MLEGRPMRDFDLSPLSFLVVDDNHHMISILRELLRALGAGTVHDARDAADAFEIVRSSPIDLAIVDYLMEPLDGLDFIRLIRTAKDSYDPELPILLLTAHTERGRIQEARDAGASDVVRKPISAERLYQRIQALLQVNRRFIKTPRYTGPDRRRLRPKPYSEPDRRKDA